MAFKESGNGGSHVKLLADKSTLRSVEGKNAILSSPEATICSSTRWGGNVGIYLNE